jgi:hypothetical protein
VEAARTELVTAVRRAHAQGMKQSEIAVHRSAGLRRSPAFDMRKPLSLMQLSSLEREFSLLIGARVDLVPEASIRPDLRERILEQAVPL